MVIVNHLDNGHRSKAGLPQDMLKMPFSFIERPYFPFPELLTLVQALKPRRAALRFLETAYYSLLFPFLPLLSVSSLN